MGIFKPSDAAEVARIINGILAPSLMISACGLLVLALQSRYSNLTDRIRLLNQERRRASREGTSEQMAERKSSIRSQVLLLMVRARHVRNSVFCLYSAVVCFVASSIAIGIRLVFNFGSGPSFWLSLFLIGMIAVLLGAIYALRDVALAFKVAELEIRDLEI